MSPRRASGGAVLGIGISSKADAGEVRELVAVALAELRLALDDVALIATRERFVDDPRLRLGPEIIGFSDSALEAASAPCDRTFGIRARVAETAVALAGAVPTRATFRSAHVTVAVGDSDATSAVYRPARVTVAIGESDATPARAPAAPPPDP
jgi:cobalamin biosynthesis protein CbiG